MDICLLSILLEPKEPPRDRVLSPGVPVCGPHPPDTRGSRGVPLGTGRLQQGNRTQELGGPLEPSSPPALPFHIDIAHFLSTEGLSDQVHFGRPPDDTAQLVPAATVL